MNAIIKKFCLLSIFWIIFLIPTHTYAIEPVKVPIDVDAIDLNPAIERHKGEGDKITVSTAPGSDGIVRRIEVRSKDIGKNLDWVVFALTNNTDEQIDRLLVAPHHRLVNSGVIWPDLGTNRIEMITASQGVRPERLDSPDADVFLITLDPGATVTYVAELKTSKLPQLYLWESDAYREKHRSLSLYQGIVIGISSLLALILTVMSLIRGKVIFPAGAALAWVALLLVTIQFGFFQKLVGLDGEEDHFWRASGEAVLSASLIVFLFAYLNLNRWHVRYSHITAGWVAFIGILIGIAYIDPSIAAGIARLSLLIMTFAGFGLILMLASHGFDRAIILIPSWLMLTIWVVVAALTVTGRLSNDLIAPAVVGGLVLVVLLICFTVLQQAYGSSSFMSASMSDVEKKALALAGSGDSIFDWDVISDRIEISSDIEKTLGVAEGELKTSAAGWLEYLHPLDRDRWRSTLDAIQEKGKGRVFMDLRLRASDSHYPWYQLRARPVMSAENQVIRVVGTLSDVTGQRTAEERMLHDAVHDNLTGLPNRALFLDRLDTALSLSNADKCARPTIMFIDIDRFRQVNDSVGFAVGDTILLTIARRLSRVLKPQDTLGRIGSDHFGIILLSENNAERIPEIADLFRKTVKAPIMLGDREVVITASIGLTLADSSQQKQKGDALADAELAATHAKRLGGDRIEVFRSTLRTARGDRLALETDLRRATERGELCLLYQPVVRLADKSIAGFEALLRWDHPRLGRLMPSDFIGIAEETGLIGGIGLFALEKAAKDLALWQKSIDTIPPLFVSVNLSSRQLLRHDLIHDVKVVLVRSGISKGSLRLELTESLVMENPEFSSHMLARLHELGASIALDDFGTGYSSLGYLQRFPLQVIKIDRSIIKNAQKGDQTAVLKSIISLSQDLGIEAIAEGVETEQEVVMLRELGCNCAQGFYFGQPMPIRNVHKLLKIEA